jgi:hypothetical protein
MPYDKLWEFVAHAQWRLIAPEYEYIAFAIGAFVVVAVLVRSRMRIWKRIETIEIRLSKMQSEIASVLQVQAALITKLNANSKVEIDPHDTTTIETDGGDVRRADDVAFPEGPKSA